jgi:hypothetical protein
MSFVVTRRPIAAFPLDIIVNGENGGPVTIKFVAQYHRHSPEQLADLRDGMTNRVRETQGMPPIVRPDGSAVPAYPYPSDIKFIEDKMAGWLGVKDASGDSIPFNPETLARVLGDWPELVIPLFNGFFAAHEGAKQKN